MNNIDGQIRFLLWYLSGVLQGCPGSAFIFNMILDLFLHAFWQVITKHGRGMVRACADDIGAALTSYKYLMHLFPIFDIAEQVSGLTLKPTKCNVVPTSEPLTETLVNVIRKWLKRNVPK